MRIIPIRAGISLSRLKELKIYYPSIKVVRNQVAGENARMIFLEIPDRRPNRSTRTSSFNDPFRITIHFTGSQDTVPTAYVINGKEKSSGPSGNVIYRGGSNLHGYDYSQRKIPGTNIDGYWICHGNFDLPYRLQKDPVKRLLAFINHISSLLNA